MAKRTVEAKDLGINLSEYLRRVKSGETIVISEDGKPIGEITPLQLALEKRIEAFVNSGAADWNSKRYRPKKPVVRNDGSIQISDLIVENRKALLPASKDIPYK